MIIIPKSDSTRFHLLSICLIIAMLLMPLSALADPSPAVQKVGSNAAAQHLCTHIGAFTDGVPYYYETFNGDDEHIFCCGSRVSMWDTPQKGENTGSLYPGSKIGTLEKNSQFELVKVESYRGKNYAMIRVYEGDAIRLVGWVSADYIACSCTDFSEGEEVPEHSPASLTYHLR
ncbi:MAG: hypothetical protein IJT77_05625 [Clostridia bacterium]|nr:hypothetical protein [Clostridia bacterium]